MSSRMELALQSRLRFCLRGQSLPLLELARELGVVHLELADDSDLDTGQVSEIKRTLDAAGIRVVSMHVPCRFTQCNGSFPPKALDEAKTTIDRANMLGAEMITFVNHSPPSGTSVADARRSFANGVALLIPEAERRGLRPTFCNLGGLAAYYGQARYLKQLCEEFAPQAMFTFDIANWILAGESVHEALDLLAPWIAIVHLKDWTIQSRPGSTSSMARNAFRQVTRAVQASPLRSLARSVGRSLGVGRRLSADVRGMDGTWYLGAVIGEGILDHRAILSHLQRASFTGCLSIEYEGSGDPTEAFRRGTQLIRRILPETVPPACVPETGP